MNNTALLIIDAQVNMFDEAMPIYRAEAMLDTLEALCEMARRAKVPIIFVRHCGDAGDPDEPGSSGWAVHERLRPQNSDRFIDKRQPSAFAGTLLDEELKTLGINHLIVAGMQSEICISATTGRAAALGYDVTLVSDGHSTFDGDEQTAGEMIVEINDTLSAMVKIKTTAEINFGKSERDWRIALFNPDNDFDKLLNLRREIERLEPTGNDVSEDGLRSKLQMGGHDPTQDRWLVYASDNGENAIAHAWVFAQSTERTIGSIVVHPEWRQQRIGSALYPKTLDRARTYGATHVVSGHRANLAAGKHFLIQNGFEPVGNNRFFKAAGVFELPEPTWPEGFTVKSFAEVGDAALLAQATNACYHDMWGHAENDPKAVDSVRIEEGLRDSPEHFNPESIFIAFSPANEIAGVCYGKTFKHQEDEAGSGRPKKVIDSPGVVPRFRHLGLQRPLILTTMHWLRKIVGKGPMELWTFGDSEQAVALYLAMGFTLDPVDHLIEYRLEL